MIAGTGSVAYAEHGDASVLVGGAGYLLGDEGSAYAIGIAACRLLVRVLDGRLRADQTTELVQRELAAHDRGGLIAAIYGEAFEVGGVAELAKPIIALADAGARSATKIVQSAAHELAELAKATATRAGLLDHSPNIALVGGLLRGNSLLTFLLRTRIGGEIPAANIGGGEIDPVLGALRLAARAAAVAV